MSRAIKYQYNPPQQKNEFLKWYDSVFHRGIGLCNDIKEKGVVIKLMQRMYRDDATNAAAELFKNGASKESVIETITRDYEFKLDTQNMNYVIADIQNKKYA